MASFLFTNAALLDPLQPDLLEGHSVLIEDGRNADRGQAAGGVP